MITTYGIVLIAPDGKILGAHPTRHRWNQWDIPKGCKDNVSESDIDTVKREFCEETSLHLDAICSVIIDASVELNKEYEYVHRAKKLHGFIGILKDYIGIENFICKSMVSGPIPFPENDAFTWVNLADYKEVFHESQIRFITDIIEHYDFFNGVSLQRHEKCNQYG